MFKINNMKISNKNRNNNKQENKDKMLCQKSSWRNYRKNKNGNR